MSEELPEIPEQQPKMLAVKRNPFKPGFRNPGEKRVYDGQNKWTRRKSLLKMMLEVQLTANDLPEYLADSLRVRFPGLLDDISHKFTMWQVMEMTQFQLLFSKSDYVRQGAIIAIKDRVEGKPMQKVQVESLETDPTEFLLPNGRRLII
jgi:hypothetical protein